MATEEYKLKIFFLSLIDGGYEFEPRFKGIDSYTLGICKLEFVDDIFHIYCRRPGLLIGKGGRTINEIRKILKVPTEIHEFELLKENK